MQLLCFPAWVHPFKDWYLQLFRVKKIDCGKYYYFVNGKKWKFLLYCVIGFETNF